MAGGATRTESVRRGLAAVPQEATIICVHDAVRPFASPELYRSVIDAVRCRCAGAIPGVAVTDTIKQVDAAGAVVATPPRESLVAVQTPQAFRADVLRARPRDRRPRAPTTRRSSEAIGATIQVVDGDPANLKITRPADLARAADHPGEPARAEMRIGNGLRRASLQRRPGAAARARPAAGSTASVAWSATATPTPSPTPSPTPCSAPPVSATSASSSPTPTSAGAGADSMRLLAEVATHLADAGWAVSNVDCNVMCETPKLAPRRDEMQRNLAAVLGAPASVKGRRAEGLGALGRKEGIACWAVAMIERRAG